MTDRKKTTVLSAQEKSFKQRAIERAERENSTLVQIRTFKPTIGKVTPPEIQPITKSVSMQEQLNNERIREVRFKNRFRIYLSVFFAILLASQNIALFMIIIYSLNIGKLQELQLVLAALTAATLTETYFITKIIINFVFSTTDYIEGKKK